MKPERFFHVENRTETTAVAGQLVRLDRSRQVQAKVWAITSEVGISLTSATLLYGGRVVIQS